MAQAPTVAGTVRLEATGGRQDWIAMAVMLAIFLAAPFFVYPVFLMKALCFALFACAFNLLIGYGGLLSFGHAMFLGTAGYVSAHAAKVWGLTPELAILTGTLAAALLGAVVGAIAIRRQGIYFAMVTLALAQMVFFFYLQAPFTGGEDGIQAVPRGRLFGVVDLNQPLAMYGVVLAVFMAGFILIYRSIHSPFGQVLKAIRENEPRAVSLGWRADQYKLLAFVLSAGAFRHRRCDQGHRLPARLADRRPLDDVRRGRADDAAGGPRHGVRPRRRGLRDRGAGELSGPARRLGDGGAGRRSSSSAS